MEIKVNLHILNIKEMETGNEYPVETIRTGQEIAEYIVETEKNVVVGKLVSLVAEAYGKNS